MFQHITKPVGKYTDDELLFELEGHKDYMKYQIAADKSLKTWINVSYNDPRLNLNSVIVRIRPEYNHKYLMYKNDFTGEVEYALKPIA